MNYIELINRFWELDEHWQFTCCETRLYFYLLKTANRLGWANSWTHSDAKTSVNVGVSVDSFKKARNRLIQAGLIMFSAGGRGHANKSRYEILAPKSVPKSPPKLIPKSVPTSSSSTNHTLYNEIKETKSKQIPPLPPNGEDGLVEIFEEFRLAYKGMKRGLETELADFSRKHSDWKQAIPLLMPALNRELEYKQQLFVSDQFVPSWKNLKTWLTQRCWEQEFYPAEKKDELPPAIRVEI